MKYIESLREGERINEIYLCKVKQSALTKAGKPYDNLILQDKTGTLDAKIWDPGSVGIDDFDSLDYVAVMGDITSRRGKPLGQESRGNALSINAMVPLSEMFGYVTSLRSNTQGRGNFTMVFDHYEEVPKNIAEEIIKKNGGN